MIGMTIKNMLRFLGRLLFWALIISLIAAVILLVVGVWSYSNYCMNKEYGVPELIYYSTQIIAAVSTAAAVIVALFGREIRSSIFKEKVQISLVNGGIKEYLGDTANTPKPEAQNYDCSLLISNDCSREIEDLQIFLQEVKFKQDSNAKYKKLVSFENKALYWRTPEQLSTFLGVDESKRIPLFKIYPKASCQTPDSSNTSDLRMRLVGYQMPAKYYTKGIWYAKYQIRTKRRVLKTFEMTVQWNGEWYNRYSEMVDVVNVNIQEI